MKWPLTGLPVYGECGGPTYLSQGLTSLAGERTPMAGVLPLEVRMLPRLKVLGLSAGNPGGGLPVGPGR